MMSYFVVKVRSLSEPILTYNLCQAQEHLKDSSTTIRRNSSPWQGSWSTAPPSLQPPHHFLKLAVKRELFGCLLQCRTGHGYIGEYYRRFVPSADPACPCGEATQTQEHIIQSCSTYEEYHTILHQASQTLYLHDLLSTKDGIQVMASFLEKSGAFTKNGHFPPSPPHITDRQTPYRLKPPTNMNHIKQAFRNDSTKLQKTNYSTSIIHTWFETTPAAHPCSLGVVGSVPPCNSPTASWHLFACCGI